MKLITFGTKLTTRNTKTNRLGRRRKEAIDLNGKVLALG